MEYTFYLRTERSPMDLERVISRATADAPWRATPDAPPEPVWVTAAVRGTRDMIAETYGFEPDVVVSVQLDKFIHDAGAREAQAVDVLRVLLREEPGDMYADYLNGTPVLLRTAGRVAVDERWFAHRPRAAELLPGAWHVRALATV
jgi:hypothetical protein